ncbi:unnamed protein product [Darwinula stevensoni]|uniref:Uncharacterized protein n=1 Tax=Darwinula stevensoni TaxID=69355 RepID=A0A7R8XC55_9CRUS|nr:unnamed protein product [Darwinula stevensoni]CAG0893458.1 unnamed protein product [Darwinula stevensoni]
MSIQAGYQRPTLDDLHGASFHDKPTTSPDDKPADEEKASRPSQKGVHKMGWMEGVLVSLYNSFILVGIRIDVVLLMMSMAMFVSQMPCLLNIWGVMLFLRLTWVVGQAGIGEGLLLISASNLVTIITSVSMSAIATNGQIKGGGIYYMISRSLGAEFGGAIGLMFTIANSIACAMHLIGFCESIKDLLRLEFDNMVILDGGHNDTRIIGCITAVVILGIAIVGGIYFMISRSLGAEFGGAIGLMFTIANAIACAMYVIGFCDSLKDLLRLEFDNMVILDGGHNDTRIVGCATAVIVLGIAIVGLKWVSKAQLALLVILVAAQVDFIVGSFMGPSSKDTIAKGFVGCKDEVFRHNWYSAYGPSRIDDSDQGFFSVFAVFFPAVTGIVAGANMSGDLKGWCVDGHELNFAPWNRSYNLDVGVLDPGSAIPKGTLVAVFITFTSYIGYGMMSGACSVREASGNPEEVLDMENLSSVFLHPAFNCTGRDCEWGLLQNSQMMTVVSAWGPLIYGGCFAATLSSAIASIVGGPRALAKDRLYPGLHFFAVGHGPNNDPLRGYIACFLLSIACILIADLNAVATLQVNFFLAAYGLINFSAFHSSFSKFPGWRPAFKFYNLWLSLLGTGICAAVMFLIQWDVALATFAVTLILYLYVSYRRPDANWGSSTQAAASTNALRYVQSMNRVEDHVKTYRPQVLVLAGHPSTRPALMDFAHLITKSYALLIVGHVVRDSLQYDNRVSLIQKGYTWLNRHHIKGFYDVVESDRLDLGTKALLQLSGLGRLRPNMVLLGFKADWAKCDLLVTLRYVNVIHEAFDNCLAVGILRLQGGLDFSSFVEENGEIAEEKLNISKSCEDEKGESETRSTSSGELAHETKSSEKSQSSERIAMNLTYCGIGGAALPDDVLDNLTRFQHPLKKGTRMDVWWLYDDGGLTILLPYILKQRAQFSFASLRIFSLASSKGELEHEQRREGMRILCSSHPRRFSFAPLCIRGFDTYDHTDSISQWCCYRMCRRCDYTGAQALSYEDGKRR